jgi:hypothetical protein
VNVAFFSLSVVYYLGTVYLAATANVVANPLLSDFEKFLNFKNQILPAHILSSVTMLFTFYALAGLVMFFWFN